MINLVHLGDFNPDQHHYWPFVYADGAAEALCDAKSNAVHTEAQWEAPDLVCGSRHYHELGSGIHSVTLYGEPAKAYLYRSEQGCDRYVEGEYPLLRGLVVLDSEPERQVSVAAWREKESAYVSVWYWNWRDEMVELEFTPEEIDKCAKEEMRHAPEFDREMAEALLDKHDPGWRERCVAVMEAEDYDTEDDQ